MEDLHFITVGYIQKQQEKFCNTSDLFDTDSTYDEHLRSKTTGGDVSRVLLAQEFHDRFVSGDDSVIPTKGGEVLAQVTLWCVKWNVEQRGRERVGREGRLQSYFRDPFIVNERTYVGCQGGSHRTYTRSQGVGAG